MRPGAEESFYTEAFDVRMKMLKKNQKTIQKIGTLLNIGSVFQRLCKSVASALYTVDLILLLPYTCNDFEECQSGGKTGAD